MEFDVTLEDVTFKVVVISDEFGFEIAHIYAPDSKTDIAYFMDGWYGTIENEILRQLGDAAIAVEEESFNNVNR